MTVYLDEGIRPLDLILSEISGDIKIFKENNNNLISLPVDDEKLLKKNKTIWTEIEDLKNIEVNVSPIMIIDI